MPAGEDRPSEGKTISWYLVAFVDLLGHSKELGKLASLPPPGDDEARKAFLQVVKKTYGRVNEFHQSFVHFFDESSKNVNRQLVEAHLPTVKIKSQRFMDAVLLYFPLHEAPDNSLPVGNIYRALTAAAAMFLVWLSEGVPMRGGMDIGVAFEPRDNEVYGPAVLRAYELESKVAQYPRIVAGQQLLHYLKVQSERPRDGLITQLNKDAADLCFKLLVTDLDGQVAIDYLGQAIRDGLGKNLPEVFEKAQRFILAESDKHQKGQNTKLALRYKMLRSYFASRQHLWQPASKPQQGPL